MTAEHAAAALLPQHASDAAYNDAIPATQPAFRMSLKEAVIR